MTDKPKNPRTRRSWIIAATLVGVVALFAGAKALVFAHGGSGWNGGPMSPEMLSERIERGVKYVLLDTDATAEQRQQVTAILESAAKDVHALVGPHHEVHQQIHDILTAPTIDRVRLETLRAEQLGLADQASKRVVTALADAAEVLTPAQRATLIASMEKHRWHHGMH
jgi:Spy/CpxP family protein refolding chaperone